MPSNNKKYTDEMKESTVQFIIDNNKSATGAAEELGIDKNTVCRWLRDYRRKNNLPTYAESKGMKVNAPKSERELTVKNKELEKQLKKKEKELQEEREKVEILKKSLHIFMQPRE